MAPASFNPHPCGFCIFPPVWTNFGLCYAIVIWLRAWLVSLSLSSPPRRPSLPPCICGGLGLVWLGLPIALVSLLSRCLWVLWVFAQCCFPRVGFLSPGWGFASLFFPFSFLTLYAVGVLLELSFLVVYSGFCLGPASPTIAYWLSL